MSPPVMRDTPDEILVLSGGEKCRDNAQNTSIFRHFGGHFGRILLCEFVSSLNVA